MKLNEITGWKPDATDTAVNLELSDGSMLILEGHDQGPSLKVAAQVVRPSDDPVERTMALHWALSIAGGLPAEVRMALDSPTGLLVCERVLRGDQLSGKALSEAAAGLLAQVEALGDLPWLQVDDTGLAA